MADLIKAVTFVLRLEDETLTGKITNIPGDAGGLTRFGLSIKWHPELIASGYFSTMEPSEAFKIACQCYTKDYGVPLLIAQIKDQRIADSLLSSAVNMGPSAAVRILQQAAGVTADGVMGPNSIAAVNKMQPHDLLDAMIAAQIAYYKALAVAHPVDAKFLEGWKNRANALRSLSNA